ncbi:MAG: hypothetical protein IT293_18385, partial [Deltaproteobacteria bacterium]|nr:hypothetical protein [Deltaproteobacteria bacterium]
MRVTLALAATLLAILTVPASASAAKCSAAKLAATGKRVLADLGCHATAVGKGRVLDAKCTTRASRAFD